MSESASEDGDGDGFGDVVVNAEGDEAVAEAVGTIDGDGPATAGDLDAGLQAAPADDADDIVVDETGAGALAVLVLLQVTFGGAGQDAAVFLPFLGCPQNFQQPWCDGGC